MSDSTGAKRVTLLGLGAMGTALAEALLAKGYGVTVWNRTPGKAASLVAKGASQADSAGAAVAASELVLVCLLDYQSVHDVLCDAQPELAGRAVVNVTNGTPGQARELAAWASERGATYLDGGIMAIPPMIATAEAFFFYSGAQAVFDAHRDALDVLGESHYLGEEVGLAALYDLALLGGMYGMFMGIAHAYALVGAAGESAGSLAPFLARWLVGTDAMVVGTADRIDRQDYTTDVVASLAMQSAGYVNHFVAAEEQGISAELLAPLDPLMKRLVAAGQGHADMAAVVELLNTRKEGNR
ncbi:3-hydroxyisobutyrate dehydrogenase-like beta-hydroxyacid dehydrogenase [Tamaricihabitans halophyticus]|uniref:3-hydroxyisobutyrate dehydrogenase-like beta-hydroxyacid dehydrogenase n=1 Tax=Tamaricihabitans halophyticus TaxID=1262583 RepID=A0A4R2R1Q9_9PSEU|nr:NAD(P)-binding domain-containing protein [Tamaricihabitans halophyticus]TCP56443.1 3-hydroxyisobutyrate dehydrogenase-like beta-hydroxyacid dehydrogenase [Tamaricihabitans halophyticus]